MPQAFCGIGKSDTVALTEEILRFLLINRETRFSVLMRKFYHDADRETLGRAVATLVAMNKVSIEAIKNSNDTVVRMIGD